MAYINFQKEFWSDDYILKLNKDQKLAYTYIITNEKTTQCGIYELPIIKATTELGMCAEEFILHLKKFNDDKKICYSMDTQELCIINWRKHNENSSWKTYERVRKELSNVKNSNLIVLIYDPREPLFDGFKKVNIGKDGNGKAIYKEEKLIIENPWKNRFIALTDEMLSEIRQPYDKTIALRGLEGACMGHLPNTYTNTLHNTTYTNTLHKQTQTHDDYIPPSTPTLNDLFIESVECWNNSIGAYEGMVTCRYKSTAQIPSAKAIEVKNKFDMYSIEEIKESINNLKECWSNVPVQYRLCNFDSFMEKIGNWTNEANPQKRTKPKPNYQNTSNNNQGFDPHNGEQNFDIIPKYM